MIKASRETPLLLSAYRFLIAALILSPAWLREWRGSAGGRRLRDLRVTVLPGLLLGLHMTTWIVGARLTLAANASLIVNLVPVVMPFLMAALGQERITPAELLGTVLALAGAVLLGVTDFRLSRTTFLGDLLSFVSMLFFAGYLALGRRYRRTLGLWSYVVPLYGVAGLACLLPGWVLEDPLKPYALRDVALILGLALVPTVLGHTALLVGMRHLRAQVVAVCNLGQFVFAGLMAFLLFGERPLPVFYAASALLVTGAVLAIRGAPAEHPASADGAAARNVL